jgi:hypothetical protein
LSPFSFFLHPVSRILGSPSKVSGQKRRRVLYLLVLSLESLDVRKILEDNIKKNLKEIGLDVD